MSTDGERACPHCDDGWFGGGRMPDGSFVMHFMPVRCPWCTDEGGAENDKIVQHVREVQAAVVTERETLLGCPKCGADKGWIRQEAGGGTTAMFIGVPCCAGSEPQPIGDWLASMTNVRWIDARRQ